LRGIYDPAARCSNRWAVGGYRGEEVEDAKQIGFRIFSNK
jgi:hypothetical protein